MRKRVIAVTVIAVLALLVLAVLRARAAREVVLETNGRPMANLTGSIMPNSAGSPIVLTSTDSDGRLDLRGVPREADQMNVELWDSAGNIRVPNTAIELPTSGSRVVIDYRGSRTIRTTTTTYADFVLFKLAVQEVLTFDQKATTEPP